MTRQRVRKPAAVARKNVLELSRQTEISREYLGKFFRRVLRIADVPLKLVDKLDRVERDVELNDKDVISSSYQEGVERRLLTRMSTLSSSCAPSSRE